MSSEMKPLLPSQIIYLLVEQVVLKTDNLNISLLTSDHTPEIQNKINMLLEKFKEFKIITKE